MCYTNIVGHGYVLPKGKTAKWNLCMLEASINAGAQELKQHFEHVQKHVVFSECQTKRHITGILQG